MNVMRVWIEEILSWMMPLSAVLGLCCLEIMNPLGYDLGIKARPPWWYDVPSVLEMQRRNTPAIPSEWEKKGF